MAQNPRELAPTLILVRHGDTALNESHRIDSWLPVGLLAANKPVVRQTAELLQSRFDLCNPIYTSDLPRAEQTAQVIATVTLLEVVEDFDLRSWNMGYMSGKKHEDMADQIKYYIAHPLEKVPDGEALQTFLVRWRMAFERYLAMAIQCPESAILLVTHSRNIEASRYFASGDRTHLANTHSVKPGLATSWQIRGGKLREVPIPEGGIGKGETQDGANA